MKKPVLILLAILVLAIFVSTPHVTRAQGKAPELEAIISTPEIEPNACTSNIWERDGRIHIYVHGGGCGWYDPPYPAPVVFITWRSFDRQYVETQSATLYGAITSPVPPPWAHSFSIEYTVPAIEQCLFTKTEDDWWVNPLFQHLTYMPLLINK